MITEVVRFKREHLAILHEQKITASVGLTKEQLEWYENHPWTITLKVNGEVLLCGGIFPHWEGRGEAWAVVSENAAKHVIAVHKAALRLLDLAQCTLPRLEAVVEAGHTKAENWVQLLGFVCEAPRLVKYFPGQKDGALYARVR